MAEEKLPFVSSWSSIVRFTGFQMHDLSRKKARLEAEVNQSVFASSIGSEAIIIASSQLFCLQTTTIIIDARAEKVARSIANCQNAHQG